MNTDLEHKIKNILLIAKIYAINTINDFDSIMKNKFFMSLNGRNNEKLMKNVN